jgi:acyl-CoA-binding protein
MRHIKDERTLASLFRMACESFARLDQRRLEREAMTLYSLYKQLQFGDADEFETNKKTTTGLKYKVWTQQAGK